MTANKAKEAYTLYAKNIDIKDLKVFFDGDVGKPIYVHGDRKSFRTKPNVVFKFTTMHTTDGEYKCWVYHGTDMKWCQDTFEVEIPTKEEWLKVLLERATGFDAEGNKIVIDSE
jgi:hypothetical protein